LSRQRSRLAVTILLLISTVIVSVASITNLPSVEAAASITLSPTYAGKGAVVTVTGSGFTFGNATLPPTTCAFYSLDGTGAAGTLITSPFCTITSGGSVSGSFVVNGALSPIKNPYTVIVNATKDPSHYIKAQKTFTVIAINITPSTAVKGTIISVTGSLSSTATTCSISGSPVSKASCAVTGAAGGNFTGSFIVSNVGPGPYTITVTGGGVSVQGIFTVSATTPTVKLYPPVGSPGSTVVVSQNYTGVVPFPSTDTSCSITGSGGVVTNGVCVIIITNSTGSYVNASFKVGNVAAGSYSVTVTGSPSGLKASALFTVTTAFVPTIVVVPSDGPSGTQITVSGTGFSTSDTTCQLTSVGTGADPLLITSPSCSISNGVLTGKFTVGSGATVGLRAVNATGNTGDKAGVNFRVDPSPALFFYKAGTPTTHITTGGPGEAISVNVTAGTQFSRGDSSCTISSTPTGLFASSLCVIQGGRLNGTYFVVAAAANGAYAVTVKGNLGDSASALFTVTVPPSLTLTPSYGYPTQTVSFVGRGLSSIDTSCTIRSNKGPNGASLIGSSTCAISGGTATGTFVINSQATADGVWSLNVTGNPVGDVTPNAPFTVVPNITVTPTVGSVSSVIAVNGLGFSSAGTTCALTSTPTGLFAALPVASCAFIVPGPNGNGHIAGTFTVDSAALAGTYVVTASDTTYSASTTFQVGTPSAQIVITPNIAGPLQSVGVTGSGFSGNDVSCTITGYPAGSTTSCNISGGTVGGSITLPAVPAPGLYLITVTGDTLDFASNYLAVPVTTGTATTSTSTTTSVTTTTATSITTSVPVSLTTTTFTNTGISTDRSYTLTTTTITGQSTYSVSTTTTMTSIITSSTSTTVSTMITTTAIYGQAVSPPIATPSSVDGSLFGLISVMTLLGWILVRRWAF
jgi:hypothetical protein